MKKIIINPKAVSLRWLMLLMTLFFAAQSYGQNTIYDNPTMRTEYSVIRIFRPQVDISYDVEVGDHFFNYHDLSTMTTYSVQIPYWLHVAEFEIMEDTVYFCGTEELAGRGVFGWFDINSTFFGVGTIHYMVMPSTTFIGVPFSDDEIVSNLFRMAVYKVAGCTHLYMVGNGRRVLHSSNSESVLVEAWSTPLGGWSVSYTMDIDNQIYYNDVAVTDNFVVVSTSFNGGSPLYEIGYLYYSLPTAVNPASSIFPAPPATYISVNNYSTDQSIYNKKTNYTSTMVTDNIIEHTIGDGFATISMVEASILGYSAHVFKFFSVPVSPVVNHFSIPNPNSDIYFDAAYNPITMSISVVPYHGYDKILTAINPYGVVLQVNPTDRRWFSIDYVPSSAHYTVRGCVDNSSALCKIWRYQENVPNCVSIAPINTVGLPYIENNHAINQYVRVPEINENSLTVKASSNGLMIYCR